MINLKYAGLCAAGLAMNLACLLIDSFLGSTLDYDIPMYFLVGILLCIGSGFAHAAFMNIIRKSLSGGRNGTCWRCLQLRWR